MVPIKLEKRTEGEQKAYAEGYAAGKRDAVRHGRWEWDSFNIYCSKCGASPQFDSTEPLYKYCPECGARMDLEGKE